MSNNVLVGNPRKGGEFLKQLRERRQMTRADASVETDKVGNLIYDDTIRKLETAQIQNPKMVDMGTLSKVYNVTLDELASAYEYLYTPCSRAEVRHPLIVQLIEVFNSASPRARAYLEIALDSAIDSAAKLNRSE